MNVLDLKREIEEVWDPKIWEGFSYKSGERLLVASYIKTINFYLRQAVNNLSDISGFDSVNCYKLHFMANALNQSADYLARIINIVYDLGIEVDERKFVFDHIISCMNTICDKNFYKHIKRFIQKREKIIIFGQFDSVTETEGKPSPEQIKGDTTDFIRCFCQAGRFMLGFKGAPNRMKCLTK